MTEEELEELRAYFAEYDAKAPGGPAIKGIPGRDKHLEEAEVARLVLGHLDLRPSRLRAEPGGADTPPDVAADLDDGRAIGIEVTELVNGGVRALHARRRAAERKLGLTQAAAWDAEEAASRVASAAAAATRARGAGVQEVKEAYLAAYLAAHPTPEHVNRFAFRQWNVPTVAAALDCIIREKDMKLAGRTVAYSEVVLAVFTSEETITPDMVRDAASSMIYKPLNIGRVFLVFDYDPRRQGHFVAEVRAAHDTGAA